MGCYPGDNLNLSPSLPRLEFRCENPDCQRQPTYGNKGDKRPRFCSTHKHAGMHDVIARRCEHEGCMTRAAFNFHGQKTVKFCASHKLEGMQNLKSKCCEVCGLLGPGRVLSGRV